MINNTQVVSVSITKVGAPYWFGTFGQTANAALLENKRKQYPTHYTDARMARYRSDFGKQVFDCSGLLKYILRTEAETKPLIYNAAFDYSADSFYTKATTKGPISSLPELPGLGLHRSGHVGVYIGGGYLIEAKGFDYGCVKSLLKDRNFTEWFQIPGVTYTQNTTHDAPIHQIASQLRDLANRLDALT